jgi:thiol-disulfide isomerase/thioredoxin
MAKLFLVFLIIISALKCKPYATVSPKNENTLITIKLTDTLRARPPLNMEYDKWVSAYPSMKNLKAMGGVYDSKNGIKFGISIGDKNRNGKFGEIGKDFIYLTDYSEKYFEWDNSCSAASAIQPNTIINYKNNCFMVDSICHKGSLIVLKKIPYSKQANLWERIDLPLEQKMTLIDETEVSILEYLKQYPEKVEYVFVNFWAPWCAPCIEEIPQLQVLHKKNVAIINIVEEYSYEDAKGAISKYSMPGLQVVGRESISKIFNHCGKGFPYGVLYKRDKEISRGVRAHQVLKQIKTP